MHRLYAKKEIALALRNHVRLFESLTYQPIG